MTVDGWQGRVVVVAGDMSVLSDIVQLLVSAEALVAVVSPTRSPYDVPVDVRADPADPQVWRRAAPHVEQRLGPVDGAVADNGCVDVVRATFEPDLQRRGHGRVVVATAGEQPADLLSRLAGTR